MGSAGIRGSAAKFGLSTQGRSFALEMWEFAAFIANSLVFLLIGLAVAHVPFERVGWGPLAAAIMLVLVGRAATIYPLSQLFARSRWRIAVREQHVLWWGGLRGALALALALALPSSLPLRNEILIASFAVVAFSILIQGLTMTPLMRRLGLLSTSA
jgi:CPA1 family monovalent cation:H+ antiporter